MVLFSSFGHPPGSVYLADEYCRATAGGTTPWCSPFGDEVPSKATRAQLVAALRSGRDLVPTYDPKTVASFLTGVFSSEAPKTKDPLSEALEWARTQAKTTKARETAQSQSHNAGIQSQRLSEQTRKYEFKADDAITGSMFHIKNDLYRARDGFKRFGADTQATTVEDYIGRTGSIQTRDADKEVFRGNRDALYNDLTKTWVETRETLDTPGMGERDRGFTTEALTGLSNAASRLKSLEWIPGTESTRAPHKTVTVHPFRTEVTDTEGPATDMPRRAGTVLGSQARQARMDRMNDLKGLATENTTIPTPSTRPTGPSDSRLSDGDRATRPVAPVAMPTPSDYFYESRQPETSGISAVLPKPRYYGNNSTAPAPETSVPGAPFLHLDATSSGAPDLSDLPRPPPPPSVTEVTDEGIDDDARSWTQGDDEAISTFRPNTERPTAPGTSGMGGTRSLFGDDSSHTWGFGSGPDKKPLNTSSAADTSKHTSGSRISFSDSDSDLSYEFRPQLRPVPPSKDSPAPTRPAMRSAAASSAPESTARPISSTRFGSVHR